MKVRAWVAVGLLVGLVWALVLGAAAGSVPEGLPAPSLWVTPLSLDFGPVTAAPGAFGQLPVTVKNTGNNDLLITSDAGVSPPFYAAHTCPLGVPPGETCKFVYTFAPAEPGLYTATSTVSTLAGTFSVELRGEGIGARAHVDARSLNFGWVAVGHSADPQVVTVKNTGGVTLEDFTGGAVDAPFTASQNCGGGVPPGGSCQYTYGFFPTSAGTFTETSNVSTNGGSWSVDLWGRGWQGWFSPYQQVSPRSLDFGPVEEWTSGGTLAVDVTNQSMDTWITGFSGGEVDPPFGLSENCSPTLAPGDTCQFTYSFQPTGSGVFTATSDVTTSWGPFSIELRGEGLGPQATVSPLVLDFGYTDFGVTQAVTVTNTGVGRLQGWWGGAVDDPFALVSVCSGELLPGGTCQYVYKYNPLFYGRHVATTTVWTSVSTFTLELLGGMEAPLLDMAFLPSQIAAGETATLQYTIGNPNAGVTFFGPYLNDSLPAGLRVAEPLLYSTSSDCGSPKFYPQVGDTFVLLWDGRIMAGDECVVNVNVTADNIGLYANTAEVLAEHSAPSEEASAALRVGARLALPVVVSDH